MKFWTIQTKEVLNIIFEKFIYQADFSKSNYLNQIKDLDNLYNFILGSFNKVNSANLEGVIFSFIRGGEDALYYINDINEFETIMKENALAIKSLWNTLNKEGNVILELEYNEEFNPIYVDINDFQALMPPAITYPPYTEEVFDEICTNIANGSIVKSVFPSNIIQAHLPYITKANIVNIHPMFDLD